MQRGGGFAKGGRDQSCLTELPTAADVPGGFFVPGFGQIEDRKK